MKPALAALLLVVPHAFAQATSFTYQGELRDAGSLASGVYDMRFRVYNADTGGAYYIPEVCVNDVVVADGRFSVILDVPAAFAADTVRYLEVHVRPDSGLGCSNSSGYTALSPRQPITSAPRANRANTASALRPADGSQSQTLFLSNGFAAAQGASSGEPPLWVQSLPIGPTGGENARFQGSASDASNLAFLTFRNGSGDRVGAVGDTGTSDNDVVVAADLGSLAFTTSAGRAVTVTPSGMVGVGTANPSATIDVASPLASNGEAVRIRGTSATVGNKALVVFADSAGTPQGAMGDASTSDNGLTLASYVGGVSIASSFGEVVNVTPAGRVGIGTSNPAKKLTVNGDMEVGTGAGDYRHLRIGGGNSSGFLYGSYPAFGDGIHLGYNYYANSSGTSVVTNPGGATSRVTVGYGYVGLATGAVNDVPVDRLTVNVQGNVGIGTSSPAFKLDVQGTLRCFGFTNSSSRRYKHDIEDLGPTLDRLLRLRPVRFTWDVPHGGDDSVGLIAEEVQEVFPECVTMVDGQAEGIDYAKLSAVAIQAVREQQERVRQLEERVLRIESLLRDIKGADGAEQVRNAHTR